MKVTVIIPTLNEEQSIGQTIDSIPKDFANLEILIIDGASKDKTVEISKNKSARCVIEKRKGYGRAYKTGFAEARGDIICTLDGDTTYPAHEFPRLLKMLIDEDLDYITCDRLSMMEKGAMNKTHQLGNWALKVGANVLFRLKLKDSQSGMWVFKKEILEKINLVSDGMPLSEEIKIECFRNEEIKAKEVSVPYYPRIGDIKLNTWGDGKKNLLYLFKKRVGKVKPDFEEDEGAKKKSEDKEVKKEGSKDEDISDGKGSGDPSDLENQDFQEIEVETPESEKEVETDDNASVTLAVGEPAEKAEEEKEEEKPSEEEAKEEENPTEEETKEEEKKEE